MDRKVPMKNTNVQRKRRKIIVTFTKLVVIEIGFSCTKTRGSPYKSENAYFKNFSSDVYDSFLLLQKTVI